MSIGGGAGLVRGAKERGELIRYGHRGTRQGQSTCMCSNGCRERRVAD